MDIKQLKKLLKEKKYVTIKKELEKKSEVDIAEILEPFGVHTTLIMFRMLPKDVAVGVFSRFSSDQQREIIGLITDEELREILDELFFDDMIDMIEEMPANIVKKILFQTKKEERGLINQFLKYPQDSAGSIMTIEYVSLKKGMTVKEAMEHIKKVGLNRETVYTCYVMDENRRLEGIVSLRKLVISEDNQIVGDIMNRDVIYVCTHDDQETVAAIFKRYGFLALPVVDKEDRLTGIITFDDIMGVIDQENTEDLQKMAAMSPTEEKYLDIGIFTLAKHRILWLLILMISATFTGGIIRRYEEVLGTVIILAAFIPMLMDTGGNAGSQSSTLIIRGLALGEIKLKDVWKVIWKELRVSIVVGVALAVANFLRLYFIDNVSVLIAFTVSFTLSVTVVMSKVIGGVLPMLAKRVHIDPAIMAGPLITTIVDAMSLLIYFSVASKMLGI